MAFYAEEMLLDFELSYGCGPEEAQIIKECEEQELRAERRIKLERIIHQGDYMG